MRIKKSWLLNTFVKHTSLRIVQARAILCLLLVLPSLAQAAQCIALPDYRPFGDIGTDDWGRWTDLDRIIFSTQNNFLAVEMIADGNRTLRQRFVPSYQGSPRVRMRGELPHRDAYRLRQRVFFEPGFDWGGSEEHGKFGFSLSGGSIPTGGSQATDGFSARLTWRGSGDGTAKLALYSYFSDKNSRFGIDFPIDYIIPKGEWIDIVIEVSMNTNHWSSDGRARVYVNGNLSMDRSGIKWWSSGKDPVVDSLTYSAFYGGNSPEWSPDHDTYMRIADVCWEPLNEVALVAQTATTSDPKSLHTNETSTQQQIETRFAQVQQLSLRRRVANAREIAKLMHELTKDDQTIWWLNRTDIGYANALLDYQWQTDAIPNRDSDLIIQLENTNARIDVALNAASPTQPLTDYGNRLRQENSDIAYQFSAALLRVAQTQYDRWGCKSHSTNWPCNAAASYMLEGYKSRSYSQEYSQSTEVTTEYAKQVWEFSKSVLYLLP